MATDTKTILYRIKQNGEEWSFHVGRDEVEFYIAALKKVYPTEEWDYDVITPGRHKGHEEMIWAGEGVVDLRDLSLHQFGKCYTWRSEITLLPPMNEKIFIYWPMKFGSTTEGDAEKDIRRLFKSMEFMTLDDNHVQRVK